MTPASACNPEVPDWLDQLLAQACALNPHQRMASAADFAEALASQSGRPAATPSAGAPRARFRWEWLVVPLLATGLAAYLYTVIRG